MVLTFILLAVTLAPAIGFKACVPFTQCDENGQYYVFGSQDTINTRFGQTTPGSEPTECKDPVEVICEIPENKNDENNQSNDCIDPTAYPPLTSPTQDPTSFPPKNSPSTEIPDDGTNVASIIIPERPHGHEGCGLKRAPGLDSRFGAAYKNNSTEVTRDNAIYGEFPWMIALWKKNLTNRKYEFICGGSLIETDVVLTAAHCLLDDLEDYKAEELKVVAGEWDLSTDVEPITVQERKIKEIKIHENYNRNNQINDVGLIFLKSPFQLDDVVDVICLARNSEFKPTKCRATGWGIDYLSTSKHRQILRKVALPLVDHKTCQEKLRGTKVGRFFTLHKSFMCAGGHIHKDTCKGDGGGPLICIGAHGDDVRFAQVGIISWGIDCGTDTPGVYSSIDYHFDWIDQHVHLNKSREGDH